MPATVQAVLAARIDRLPPEDKRLLQTAVGRRQGRAVRAARRRRRTCPRTRFADGLARLQAAEFLYETSLFPDLEYTFKHALTHEVAYGSLLQERRRAPARPDRRGHRAALSRPARRARRAAGPPRAPGRGVGQGRRLPPPGRSEGRWPARPTGRPRRYLEQALAVARHLPESPATLEQAFDLRLELRHALCSSASTSGARAVSARPRRSPSGGDERRLAGSASYRGCHC